MFIENLTTSKAKHTACACCVHLPFNSRINFSLQNRHEQCSTYINPTISEVHPETDHSQAHDLSHGRVATSSSSRLLLKNSGRGCSLNKAFASVGSGAPKTTRIPYTKLVPALESLHPFHIFCGFQEMACMYII